MIDLIESRKILFFVIPAKAGIQFFQAVVDYLDSGFHRSDKLFKSIKMSLFLLWKPLKEAYGV